MKKSKEFGDSNVQDQNNKVSMINEFFEKLIMVTRQKGQLELDEVIYKEIEQRNKIEVGREVDQQVTQYFKTRVASWWRNKKEKMHQKHSEIGCRKPRLQLVLRLSQVCLRTAQRSLSAQELSFPTVKSHGFRPNYPITVLFI